MGVHRIKKFFQENFMLDVQLTWKPEPYSFGYDPAKTTNNKASRKIKRNEKNR